MANKVIHSTPVRTRSWPSWPVFGNAESDLLRAAVEAGIGSDADAPLKTEFQQRWAEFTGARHALAVTNGTISLQIALQALGVGAGDEVIVPPYTFAATATAPLALGALPVFADIQPDTYNIDPVAVEAAVTDRTKAVIAVHLAGAPADMDALSALCGARGIALIEDAAHAHGARWNGRPVGTFGDFGSWSFQASKNLSSGEGGALVTNDAELAEAAWGLHNCGRRRNGPWYAHYDLGGNYRLTEWQSAVLLTGLERLPKEIARREECAAILDRELSEVDGIRPLVRDSRVDTHAQHIYILRYDPSAFGGMDRDTFVAGLQHHGIPAMAGYPFPLYRQPLFAEARFDQKATGWDSSNPATKYGDLKLPVCEQACADAVWLPQELLLAEPDEMVDVVEAVTAVQRAGRGGVG
ncbi:DegT/DnrJ/EryC1/StrS family aminotransferase [Streptomyces sp. NPDC048639]|uniref:DegT/DnrJ/EryC1/StrS family aminotransferase n=1 Tax=Streptomyces sp. NPDC048639 TaxID=3365581 RepID=UPI00371C8C89